MSDLQTLLDTAVAEAAAPGAVALLARGDDLEVAAAGVADLDTKTPMARDTLFRFASVTKPVTAAGVLLLVEDGVLGLDDPIARWLPELEHVTAVRMPQSPVDDVVPAARPITVFDVLTGRPGWGFPSDFTLPQVQALFAVQNDGREVQRRPAYGEWLAALAQIPLLYQPGEAWLYDTPSDLQGVLIARASGRTLPEFLAERILGPLGMDGSAFVVPEGDRGRFTSFYGRGDDGGFVLRDAPDGQWSTMPAFPAGSAGLAGPVDDLHRFGRALLGELPLLSPASRELMLTDHLTPEQREIGALFLEGQGWGCGGSVDVAASDPWTVPGRYGWVGGTGTSLHVTPSTGTVAVLLTQVAAENPESPPLMRDFWTLAAT
jgi:CubicO group peptidase (beta-lactamase class C family)